MRVVLRNVLLVIVFASIANAAVCMCMREIDNAWNNLLDEVEEAVNGQIDAIESSGGLITQIEKNTEDIKEQSKVIEQLIAGEKQKALQNTEIISILRRIIELKNTGEM